jgi:phage tail sheath protein FI
MGGEYLYPGVYIEETSFSGRPIDGVSTSTTGFIGTALQGPLAEAVRVTSFVDFQRSFGGLQANVELGYGVFQFFENGGQDAWVVRVNDQSEVQSALSAFDAVDSIGLLCIPGCVDMAALSAAAAYSDQRRIFFIVDPPSSDIQAVQDLAAALRATGTSNAAIYFPPISTADPLGGGAARVSSPSGSVAGMIARTDLQRGVWTAPAGVGAQLVGVLGVTADIDDATAQLLAAAGVNSIRSIPHSGIVVLAAHTTSGVEQWRYVQVRRLALYIESSLVSGLQWAVFEPNDQPLWIRMCSVVTAFLAGLWRQGAFQGSRADEAFMVECGRDVMTQADITEGRAVLLVGFAPTRPSEMVILRVIVEVSG